MKDARHALVAQLGGPTAVMNASLAAIIAAWQRQQQQQGQSTSRLFGARLGVRGLVAGDWTDLTHLRESERQQLHLQAGAALGSARDPLDDHAIGTLLPLLTSASVGLLFAIGGNGSLTAAHRLATAARSAAIDLQVLGVPKTIDNDVEHTEVTPGYGSAARFLARIVHDAALDLYSMRGFDDVAVIEVMGRHTGWLAAAASLARWTGQPVHPLILIPERPLDEERFLAAVRERHRADGVCLVIAAEGTRDRDGCFLAEKVGHVERDARGQQLLALAGGPAPYLARLVQLHLKLRCRQIRPDTIQRSNGALASSLDRDLAARSGDAAVAYAAEGRTDVMVALRRNGTHWQTEPVPLDRVAGTERLLPDRYIAPELDIAPSFADDFRAFLDDWRPGAVLFSGPRA
jgi:ATP-dependent phosphofructokinase / diphosphate-dependent phosphofructokinase